MRARDLMRPVSTVRPDDPAGKLIEAFKDPEVRAVAVLSEVEELIGAFTDEDMLDALLPSYVLDDEALARVLEEEAGTRLRERLEGKRVKDVFDPEGGKRSRVGPGDTLIEVATAMSRSGDPAVLVVEGNRVIGVIPVDVLLPVLLGRGER